MAKGISNGELIQELGDFYLSPEVLVLVKGKYYKVASVEKLDYSRDEDPMPVLDTFDQEYMP